MLIDPNNSGKIEKPKFLYKYHSMSIYLMEMMTNAPFYMSTKSELNGPLDPTYTIELEDYLKLYFYKYPSLTNDPKHLELVKHVF